MASHYYSPESGNPSYPLKGYQHIYATTVPRQEMQVNLAKYLKTNKIITAQMICAHGPGGITVSIFYIL